jgi:hypothetical protein
VRITVNGTTVQTGEVQAGFLCGDLRERAHLEDLRVDEILMWILKKWGREEWTGLIWRRKGTGGGRL